MNERNCENCKHHTENGCASWDCEYDPKDEDCRNCKNWSDCECGEIGHKNGTSIGYSIGECKDFKEGEGER